MSLAPKHLPAPPTAPPKGTHRHPVSAVLIVRDEAASLPATLEALSFAEEILVVDSGSRDDTVDIARTRGARVVHQDWLGFGQQKQFAVTQAKHNWVLCVDADEKVTPALRAAIESELAAPKFRAYAVARSNRFLGRYLRHGEGYPDWNLRLFDRRAARWSDDPVHEKVETEWPVGRLTGDLLHDSADTLERYLAKQNRYTSIAARKMFEEGKQVSVGKLLLSPLVRFIKFYVLKLGFLDGLPGFMHILIGCATSFLKYAKLIEFQKRDKK